MKQSKRLISLFLTAALLATVFSAAVIPVAAAKENPYSEAAMQLDKDYAYDGELGAIYTPEGTTFKVWARLR